MGRKILKYQKVTEIKTFIPGEILNTNIQTIQMLKGINRPFGKDKTSLNSARNTKVQRGNDGHMLINKS